jgi:hypothetical protein
VPRIPAIHEDWNKDMVYSMTTNSLLTVNDELWYYFTAGSGFNKATWHYDGWTTPSMDRMPRSATHNKFQNFRVKFRRDGFASLDSNSGTGTITTERLSYKNKAAAASPLFLFVNVDFKGGSGWLCVDVLNAENRQPIEGYNEGACKKVTQSGTCTIVQWTSKETLPDSASGVRLRFRMENAALYSFWVSPDNTGITQASAWDPGTACRNIPKL